MTRLLLAFALLGVCAGCARFPETGDAGFTKRLAFTLTVDGRIRTGRDPDSFGLPYIYMVALRLSTDPNPIDDGPIPIVQPGGNGFVAGNATHFILYNPLSSPPYEIWQFRDASLNEWSLTGFPVNFVDVEPGGNTLRFEVDLSQLVPAGEVDAIESVQVNLLTMDTRDPGADRRRWDALGDGRNPGEVNSFLEFQLRQARRFDNQTTNDLEPVGDTQDPDLDISDWSVELRLR